MANIMLNEICNLRCPYCFADEFVNKAPKEITMDDFRKALEFSLSSGPNERIGIIGGEPTLHSRFKEIMSILINDPRVGNVTVFTNGTRMSSFYNEFGHPKMHVLLNCNSPANMGRSEFEKMCECIDTLINERYLRERLTLGINMYKPDFEYEYIIDLLKKYSMKSLRTSVSVPNDPFFNTHPLDYFTLMKPRVMEFFERLAEIGVIPFFDCNAIPPCVWTKEERASAAEKYPRSIDRTNIFFDRVKCNPVIDILPDLTVIRCFGMSETTKKAITDFENIEEARCYYIKNIDSVACHTVHSEKCLNCKANINGTCWGGCLCFKAKNIVDLCGLFESATKKNYNND